VILLGLLLLIVAVVIAVVGVLSNIGSTHLLTRSFEILGYHITGSTGRLLLIGVILGAAGMLGLNLLLAGMGRGIKRRVSTRRQLKADHKEQQRLAAERDQLSRQLEDERREKLAAGASLQDGRTPGEDTSGVGAREVRTTRRVSE